MSKKTPVSSGHRLSISANLERTITKKIIERLEE